ncbi:MAG: cytochrome c oxidase assembly protein [Actinobacteria bacterium]|nr:cytochrome c oxidase assembly protein [Actinomycetota bacterium]
MTVFKFTSITSSFLLVGALLAITFLTLDINGKVVQTNFELRKLAAIASLIWMISNAFFIVFTLANILNTSVSEVLQPNILRSFLLQIPLGQYLFVQLLLSIFISLVVPRFNSIGTGTFLLLATLIAIVIPVFQSHSASSGSHSMAIGSLAIHVIALALWVGGVFAIAFLAPESRAHAVPRFSVLALWAAIAVVISGSVNAFIRLDFKEAWASSYAYLVLAKVFLTAGLIVIGYLHRKNLKKLSEIKGSKFLQLILAEAVIMTGTLAIGSLLASSQPPERETGLTVDRGLSIVGVKTPQPPSLSRILLGYEPDALMIGLLVIAVALYIKGVMVLTKRGDKWPVGRTISFAIGISAVDFATSGGLGLYAHFSFSWHMVAHMTLGMIAPIAIVLGAPITLALRTLPQGRNSEERGVRGTLLAVLHSRYSSIIVNPVGALVIFDGSLFLLYFTSLFGTLMNTHAGHLFMNIHFLLVGFLFFHVIIGIDPNPKRPPFLVRIVTLLAAMSIHAFFSVALMSSSTLIDSGYFAALQTPWVGDLLADQNKGGAIGWAMGEIPILIALVATFIMWTRDDAREARRIDRSVERMAAMGQPDELAQYNKFLQELADRERRSGK